MKENNVKKIAIIGAGASGLTAAITAAGNGASVVVYEHMQEAGIKLALTGSGKCNYTNTDVGPTHYHCADMSFVETVLSKFSYEECIAFFRQLGIEPLIRYYDFDETGYVYPDKCNADGVRELLKEKAESLGAEIKYGVSLASVEGLLDDPEYDALILACGSNAYPATGSDSSIYPVIKKLGLEFHTFLPALCALFTKDEKLQDLKGKRVRDTAVLRILSASGEVLESYSCSGEIQFTEHSISGIPVMQLSRFASIALKQKRKVRLEVNGHEFDIHRTAGFDRSQVCSGGIAITEIEAETMRCRKHPRVYVCGEILDVDGECGGYNLHWAWASGFIAGKNASNLEG